MMDITEAVAVLNRVRWRGWDGWHELESGYIRPKSPGPDRINILCRTDVIAIATGIVLQEVCEPFITQAVKLAEMGWTGPAFIGRTRYEEPRWRALAAFARQED